MTETATIAATTALSQAYHLEPLRKETRATLPIVTAVQAPRVAPAIRPPSLITWRKSGSSPVAGLLVGRCCSQRSRVWRRKPLALEEVGPEGGGKGSEYND